jgi:hypothetical protein
VFSSTCADIPLSLISTGIAILTSVTQVTIAAGRPQLGCLLPLIELHSLIFHKTCILKLAKIDISKIFNQVPQLSFVLFNFIDIYYLINFKVLENYLKNKGSKMLLTLF